MAASRPKRSPDRPRVHPGAVLREDVLPAIGKPKAEIARLLGISRQTLYDILEERQPITPAMALRIGKLLDTTPESWLGMQQAHDLWRAAQVVDLKKIPTLEMA